VGWSTWLANSNGKRFIIDISMVVPTFNEAENIAALVARIDAALSGFDAEIVFVDDSTDHTSEVIGSLSSRLPIRLFHRKSPIGGLSGAVVAGIAESTGEWVVVMDGDLQHPPELIPVLINAGVRELADVVVASRHLRGGSSAGLDGWGRAAISSASRMLTRAMFPVKLRHCSDPMTGFFAVRRASIDVSALRPQGFKILLEILARSSLTVIEEPFVFAERQAGQSKATFGQGLRFLSQVAALRFGRLSGFALIGALGAVANLAIMAGLQAFGVWYLLAAIISAVATMVGNFLLQEHLIFSDLRVGGYSTARRFFLSFGFNAAEAAARTTLLWLIVESTPLPSLLVQACLIAVGFLIRFVYHSRVVYQPRAVSVRNIESLDEMGQSSDRSYPST
jgi:dolichol-phosphate mannosyltransferase